MGLSDEEKADNGESRERLFHKVHSFVCLVTKNQTARIVPQTSLSPRGFKRDLEGVPVLLSRETPRDSTYDHHHDDRPDLRHG
jgi:hypothetical protein